MTESRKLTDILKYGANSASPKVTIILPTHRRTPENQQDKIVFKNLIKQAQVELNKYPRRCWEALTKRIMQLLDDTGFWLHTSEGLVVLGCEERMETFKLNYDVERCVKVGGDFHIGPLFVLHETLVNTYLVDLSKDRIELYCVSKNSVVKMEDDEIETSFSDLFDDWDVDSNLNVGTYSGLKGMRHGHRTKPEEIEKDREKYFRYLDRKFGEISKSSGHRFILAGIPDNLAAFKKIAQEGSYYAQTIAHPLSSLDESELLEKTRKILKPALEKTIEDLGNEIHKAENASKLLTSPKQIEEAATQGMVDLIIYAKKANGYIDEQTDRLMNRAVFSGSRLIVLNDVLSEHDIVAILR
jgi:hypothetical protein